ncbi:hypothetical protein C8R43DRAFT_1119153 [Mycena crocata]|nr:hypothetical protein C8R43DRAFT_1119153 [Mycena crocata]
MNVKPKLEPDGVSTETDRLTRELQCALADNHRLRQDNKRLQENNSHLSQCLGRSAVKNEPREIHNEDNGDASTVPSGSGVKAEMIEILDDGDASRVSVKTEKTLNSISRSSVALKREQDTLMLSGHSYVKEEATDFTQLDDEDLPPSLSSVKEGIMEISDSVGQALAVQTPKIRAASLILPPPPVYHLVHPTESIVKRKPSLSPIPPSGEIHGVKGEDIGIPIDDDPRTSPLPIPTTSLTCSLTPPPSAPPVYSNRVVSKRQRSPSPTPRAFESDVCSPRGSSTFANAGRPTASGIQLSSVAPTPSKRQKVALGEEKPLFKAAVADDALDVLASYFAGLVPLVITPPLTETPSLPSRSEMQRRFGGGGRRRGRTFTKAPLADRGVQFLDEDTKPGDPGVYFSGAPERIGTEARAVFLGRMKQGARVWEYLGQYLNEVVGALTAQQFAAQNPQFQRAWGKKVVTGDQPRAMRARIALRKAGQAITLTSITAEKRKRPLAVVTVDDVIQALTCGEEAISVVRMTCVSYDREFVQVLVDARREQEASGIKAPVTVGQMRGGKGRKGMGRTRERPSSPSGSEFQRDSEEEEE